MPWYPAEDWRVRRTFNPITRNDEVLICQHRSQHDPHPIPVIVEISTGPIVTTDVDPLTADPKPLELRFPEGVLEAIAEVVKPGPSQGEVKRLEECLAVERDRVNKALALPYVDPDAPIGKLTARAADLRTGLELALEAATIVYNTVRTMSGEADAATVADMDRCERQLAALVETLKGTIERDDRLRA